MTRAIADIAGFTLGLDVDRDALEYATRSSAGDRITFAVAAGESLPLADSSFDVAVCNHVYEHVSDPVAMMAEIARVLRSGGVCYFAGGHTLQIIEPHHGLPFLSWLPRSAADLYIQWAARAEKYEERFLPPWQVHTLFRRFSTARFVSPDMLQDWRHYDLCPPWWPHWMNDHIPRYAASLVAWMAPTYIWLLVK